MYNVLRNLLKPTLALVVGATVLVGCRSEGTVAPDGTARRIARGAVLSKAPDLGSCDRLAPPAGSKMVFHVYARGVQIYRWTGSAWTLYGPSATLAADAAGKSVVGTHYVGPTWESNSGSKVVGTTIDRCTPNPDAVAWLLLSAKASGNGVFHAVTHIQRVNTVGGVAPSTLGAFLGDEVSIPYSTEYFFYRAPGA